MLSKLMALEKCLSQKGKDLMIRMNALTQDPRETLSASIKGSICRNEKKDLHEIPTLSSLCSWISFQFPELWTIYFCSLSAGLKNTDNLTTRTFQTKYPIILLLFPILPIISFILYISQAGVEEKSRKESYNWNRSRKPCPS